jgi:hypothetical protein
MTILEKIAHFRQVWRLALPHLPVPEPADAVRWCTYDLQTVEAAILRTAQKFAEQKLPQGFSPQSAYKYVTATARSIAQRQQVVASSR